MLKYLKSRTGSSKKKDKEISLTAQDGPGGNKLTVKIPLSTLMEHSQVFHDMTKMDLKKYKKTKLEGVTVAALKNIIQYLHQEEINFQDHIQALETLKASQKFKIKDLQKMCVDHLANTLESSNVCEIFETALSMSLSLLEYFCLRHIDEHALDVFTSRGFLALDKPAVRQLISRSSLNIGGEKAVFDAVLGWGFNRILREGLHPNDEKEVMRTIQSLLSRVRFSVMSDDELDDPEVSKYFRLMSSDGPRNRVRTISGVSESSAGVGENIMFQSRRYVTIYTAGLNVYESNQHTIKTGETFCLRVEILKGTVFVTGVTLAMGAFAATKDSACLYVTVTATNVSTTEQTTKRGAFLNTTEKATLVFPGPLVAKEAESIVIALSAKRAENVCPFSITNDIQIVMPDSQKVAMKIIPPNSTSGMEDIARCIFGEIEYFF